MANKETKRGFAALSLLSSSIAATKNLKEEKKSENVDVTVNEENVHQTYHRGRPKTSSSKSVFTSVNLTNELYQFIRDYSYEERLMMRSAYQSLLSVGKKLYELDSVRFMELVKAEGDANIKEVLHAEWGK